MRRVFLALLICAAPACAKAPESSLTPETRPGSEPVSESLSPEARPKGIAAIIRAAVGPKPAVSTSGYGAICGDRGIRGQSIPPIKGRISGCGVANPVRVYEVDGVRLSTPADVNCDTARALKRWVADSVRPAVGRTGGGVKSLRVAGHYVCRTRNHRPGAKLSEHAKGNAIDISAITLVDGTTMTVARDWRGRFSKVMRRVHKEACGPFGTVLGPNADRYHQDHFHFDVARHRGGPYCR